MICIPCTSTSIFPAIPIWRSASGRIFGFHFDENFNHPYLCKDITEFWQRWHISLGTFFRDYLLPLPVFGIRNKYLSLGLVWLCTGIWHGASWNYILWGVYYGAFILLETKIGKKKMRKIPIWLRHIYNKLVIIIGFGIFYFEDGRQLLRLPPESLTVQSQRIFQLFRGNVPVQQHVPHLCGDRLHVPAAGDPEEADRERNPQHPLISVTGTVLSVALLVTSSILLVDSTTKAFLYYRF